jgi:hypothetical protein
MALPAAELNKTVSPEMPRTPGAPMTFCVILFTQFPLVLQEPPALEFHWACPEQVTVAVPARAPLTACTVAEPPASGGV